MFSQNKGFVGLLIGIYPFIQYIWWVRTGKTYLYLVLIMLYAGCFRAQDKTGDVKPQPKAPPTATKTPIPKKQMITYSKLSFKAGLNLSVIYLARNTKENNNEPGYSLGAVYEINDFIRVSGLYTKFRTINIEPTWTGIKAATYEVNLEILARFPNKKTLLYPFAGFSYNTYRGFFTGQDDYLSESNLYHPNSQVSNQWLGFNFGVGFEHNFGPFGIYIDYRMRVGRQEKAINIMDVCYSGGIKFKIPRLMVNGKRILRNPNDRFHWF